MEAIVKSSNVTNSKENGKTSYTLREEYDNEESKTVRVREVENGFVISIEHSYYEKEGENRHYKCDEKQYISKTNPLLEIKEDKPKIDPTDTKAVAKSISSFISGMTNKMIV